MNGCNLPLVIMKPFKNPTNAPITKAAKTATNIPLPDTKREAQTAPLMARIEPTDKSIPPVNITGEFDIKEATQEKILKCAVEIKEGHRDVISSEETA